MKTFQSLFLLVALILSVQFTIAQDLITIKHSCSFDGEETNHDFYVFNASGEANKIVSQIVDAVNLTQNFIVKSADCKNALATSEGRQRYILYNTSFLEDFKKDAKTRWAAYCVMAHEIGHHLNNHDFEVTDNRKRKVMELEADKFAGGVMYTLGASLEEAKAGIQLLQSNGESNTHPPARARAEAIANGWKNSQEKYAARNNNNNGLNNTPPATTNEPAVSNDAANDWNNGKTRPPAQTKSNNWEPQQQTQQREQPAYQPEEPTYTEVSDLLLAQQIVGTWECSWYNEYSQLVAIRIALYQDYSILGESYLNGVLASQNVGNWGVVNGQFVETNAQGVFYKYDLNIQHQNAFSITYRETNGVATVPVGTTFNYIRLY